MRRPCRPCLNLNPPQNLGLVDRASNIVRIQISSKQRLQQCVQLETRQPYTGSLIAREEFVSQAMHIGAWKDVQEGCQRWQGTRALVESASGHTKFRIVRVARLADS